MMKSRSTSNIFTHVCLHCNTILYLSWKKNSYNSNKACYHLSNFCNEAGKASIQDKLSLKEIAKDKNKKELLQKSERFANYMGAQDLVGDSGDQQTIAPIVQASIIGLSYEDRALNAQAH